jgi:hypothetical protein
VAESRIPSARVRSKSLGDRAAHLKASARNASRQVVRWVLDDPRDRLGGLAFLVCLGLAALLVEAVPSHRPQIHPLAIPAHEPPACLAAADSVVFFAQDQPGHSLVERARELAGLPACRAR